MLVLLLFTPYVRTRVLGAVMAGNLPRKPALLILALVAVTVVWILVFNGLILLSVLGVAVLFLRRGMLRRIGGATGDTPGAGVEITEAVVLMVLALSIPH